MTLRIKNSNLKFSNFFKSEL